MSERSSGALGGSYRDPCGYVYRDGGTLLRCVLPSGADNYAALMNSGLYAELSDAGLLVSHTEEQGRDLPPGAVKVLLPEQLPFISYPYEWCFSQLKEAALLTLRLQAAALRRGLTLRDASAYNVQFKNCRPIFMDTLSFGKREEGQPWTAYRQFCAHFLAPLALMAHEDARLGKLLRVHPDGLPLDLASRLLPASTWLKPGLLTHIHLHSRAETGLSGGAGGPAPRVSEHGAAGLLDSLEACVRGLNLGAPKKGWAGYYGCNTYSTEAFEEKKKIVSSYLQKCGPGQVWDLGANDGTFSRLAAGLGHVAAFDLDHGAVELNFIKCRESGQEGILPLVMDLRDPSPASGWSCGERFSLQERGPAGTALALALIHHLCLAGNVPLPLAAEFFSRVCGNLIIEFVPKQDPMAAEMLGTREDIFPGYSREGFEEAFLRYFEIVESATLPGPGRVLYLFKARPSPVTLRQEE